LVGYDAVALDGIRDAVADAPLARVLVYAADAVSPGDRETTPPALVELVRRALGRPGVPVGGGTDMYFCELNRTRPDTPVLDVVAWSINPQVHAFDERSIMETPPAQAATVRSASAFAPGVPLAVTPVTLKPRFNANATRPEDDPAGGELPVPVDPRQASLFGAAWTVASLKQLVEAGAASLTYFEPIGWRGLIESETGPPLPERFPSEPGLAFPLYHVLADLAGRRGDEVLAIDAGDDLTVAGLALRGADGLRVLAANLTAEPVDARVTGLPDGPAAVRVLDAGSADRAGRDPQAFRGEAVAAQLDRGALRLPLGPYAVATIDIPQGGAAA
jgi:D-apionolactonase